MAAMEITASFKENGKLKIDNRPNIKNRKVKLIILLAEDEAKGCHQFSGKSLSTAYYDNEPDYSVNITKELNPHYLP